MENDPNSLLELLRQSFNEEELRELCLELGIDFEDLPASMGKKGKCIALIKLCAHENKLTPLIGLCQAKRAHITWPDPNFLNMDELLGKPVKPPQKGEPELKLVPAGSFLMGSQSGDNVPGEELPQHELFLPDYYIGLFPIMNEEYAIFLELKKHPKPRGWLGTIPPAGKEQHPVVNVSWFDAATYCQWLADYTGRPYRLPTEAEWEKAARGDDGRLYPWGNEWQDNLCNHNNKGTTAFNTFPAGVSPYGCHDMLGNVREWTSTIWGNDPRRSQYPYPYQVDDGREDKGADPTLYRIIRGSSFKDRPERHRCANRTWYAPDNKNRRRGFRVVMAKLQVN